MRITPAWSGVFGFAEVTDFPVVSGPRPGIIGRPAPGEGVEPRGGNWRVSRAGSPLPRPRWRTSVPAVGSSDHWRGIFRPEHGFPVEYSGPIVCIMEGWIVGRTHSGPNARGRFIAFPR